MHLSLVCDVCHLPHLPPSLPITTVSRPQSVSSICTSIHSQCHTHVTFYHLCLCATVKVRSGFITHWIGSLCFCLGWGRARCQSVPLIYSPLNRAHEEGRREGGRAWMAADGRQKGIGSPLSGDRANSVMRPAVAAKPSRNWKHAVSEVNILSGFIRSSVWKGDTGPAHTHLSMLNHM